MQLHQRRKHSSRRCAKQRFGYEHWGEPILLWLRLITNAWRHSGWSSLRELDTATTPDLGSSIPPTTIHQTLCSASILDLGIHTLLCWEAGSECRPRGPLKQSVVPVPDGVLVVVSRRLAWVFQQTNQVLRTIADKRLSFLLRHASRIVHDQQKYSMRQIVQLKQVRLDDLLARNCLHDLIVQCPVVAPSSLPLA